MTTYLWFHRPTGQVIRTEDYHHIQQYDPLIMIYGPGKGLEESVKLSEVLLKDGRPLGEFLDFKEKSRELPDHRCSSLCEVWRQSAWEADS